MPGDKSSRLRFLGGGVVVFVTLGGVFLGTLFGVEGASVVTAVAVGEVVGGETGVGKPGVGGIAAVGVASGEAVGEAVLTELMELSDEVLLVSSTDTSATGFFLAIQIAKSSFGVNELPSLACTSR